MDVSIEESLLIMWSVMIVPALVVLLYASFTGRLTADEDRRFLPIREPEADWWDESDAGPDRGGVVTWPDARG